MTCLLWGIWFLANSIITEKRGSLFFISKTINPFINSIFQYKRSVINFTQTQIFGRGVWMNSYERLFSCIDGRTVDKIPNLSIVMAFAAKYSGITYRTFILEPEAMVESNLKCHEDFGIDVVTVMSDPYGETQDYGALVEYPEDANPICRVPFLGSLDDIGKLKVRSVQEGGRMDGRLKTIRLYKRAVKGKVPIVGWVEGAFAEYIDLRGINNAMLDVFDDLEKVKYALDIITEQAIVYLKEQINQGADIIGVGDSVASLISREMYRDLVLPYEKLIISAIHEAGAKSKLHICGDITALLDLIPETGADILDIDWMVDYKKAVELIGDKLSINGNLDPIKVIMSGTPAKISSKVVELSKIRNDKAMISGGCEIPSFTLNENLFAIHETLMSLKR